MEEQKDSKEENQEYSFLQETIKEKQGGIRKFFFRAAGWGLVFGVCASLSFFALKPMLDERFQDNPQEVTIPQDEDEVEGEEENQDQEQTEPVILNDDSYRQMQQELKAASVKAGKSMVEIVGWTESQGEAKEASGNNISGLIVADNGRELLVLGKKIPEEEAEKLQIVFCDGQSYPASLKKSDSILGFGIYAVNRADILDTTWTQIETATLGSSNVVKNGDVVIAAGRPFGVNEAVGYGLVVSNEDRAELTDGHYQLLRTDITGIENGSGFVVNRDGAVVAVIDQNMAEEGNEKLITGYGISDIKNIIECLSNGKSVPYIGIRGGDVTNEIEEAGVPQGIYVKEVEVESPAMAAGIQSGDVITCIEDIQITSYDIYHSVLMRKSEGDKIIIKGLRQGADGYVDIEFNVTVGSKK
ncbi:S1C family serine protease [Blautia obeum]|uniref:S1C family serine protease n=1 Tax=Blautia obeum TaxID=40520 RepID=UPI003D02112C